MTLTANTHRATQSALGTNSCPVCMHWPLCHLTRAPAVAKIYYVTVSHMPKLRLDSTDSFTVQPDRPTSSLFICSFLHNLSKVHNVHSIDQLLKNTTTGYRQYIMISQTVSCHQLSTVKCQDLVNMRQTHGSNN